MTCGLRTYEDKLVFLMEPTGKNRKTIKHSQIVFFETAQLFLGFSVLKRICYIENGKKRLIEFVSLRSDSIVVALRRHMPEKEITVPL